MSNTIYSYRQSSCVCDEKQVARGPPGNTSVRGCNYNDYNRPFLQDDGEPKPAPAHQFLNPQVWEYDAEVQHDARLKEPIRSTSLLLDRAPIHNKILLNEINTREDLRGYGQRYQSYADVNGGQIMYYNRSDRPFFDPLFTEPAKTVGFVYKDPMDRTKPVYYRDPVRRDNHLRTKDTKYTGGLSWINDSTSHREDLMARQMAVRNQRDWELRWPGQ